MRAKYFAILAIPMLGCVHIPSDEEKTSISKQLRNSGASASILQLESDGNSISADIRVFNSSSRSVCFVSDYEEPKAMSPFVYVERASDHQRFSWGADLSVKRIEDHIERDMDGSTIINSGDSIGFSVSLKWSEFKPFANAKWDPPEPQAGRRYASGDPLVLVAEVFPTACRFNNSINTGDTYRNVVTRSRPFRLP